MSIKKISKEQPNNFKFNEKNMELVNKIKHNYPNGREKSAVMPYCLAQKQMITGYP